jgi:hypothetical protein
VLRDRLSSAARDSRSFQVSESGVANSRSSAGPVFQAIAASSCDNAALAATPTQSATQHPKRKPLVNLEIVNSETPR